MGEKRREAGLRLYAPGTIQKRSPFWYVRGTYRGRSVFESTRSRGKPPAGTIREIERRIDDEIAHERDESAKRAEPAFLDAAEFYLMECATSKPTCGLRF